MGKINVLMTCASMHSKGMIKSLIENEEDEIHVYATNSSFADLPPNGVCDKTFVSPSITSSSYIDFILDICHQYKIDIIVPCVTLELEFMAKNKMIFENHGIKVSVSSLESLQVANNKIELYKRFEDFMPKQCLPVNGDEAINFALKYNGKVCVKVANQCGGKGFAIVDNEKALDVMLFHRFGVKHYITTDMLKSIADTPTQDIILQEYINGKDYTVSVLAEKSNIVNMVGYVGHIMEFGSIMYGEIMHNNMAYTIAEKVIRDCNLDGNVGIDFILKEDGSVVLLEVNPRINASLPFVKEAGCNLLYGRCKMLLGDYNASRNKEVKVGLKMKKYFETEYFI